MAGQSEEQDDTDTTPVPDLIERYRTRRDAWIAQADELARLRDEVRGSAEREALEIVTAARRDVRKVIMDARRELLVLSAQVQAALGEVTAQTDPAALLNKAGITPDGGRPVLTAGETPTAAELAVSEILNEVHEDMTSLAEDARALPLQVVPPPRPDDAPPVPLAAVEPQLPPAVAETVAPHPWALPQTSTPVEPFPLANASAMTEPSERTLISSPFPSEAVPVQAGKRLSAFVGVFGVIGLLVAGVTIWWFSFRSPGTSQTPGAAASSSPAKPSIDPSSTAQPSAAGAADAAPASPTPADRGNLSIVAEAVRDVWVRTTIDGRSDDGRTLAAGQVIDVSAEQSISLRVGDAGAIVVSVNHGEKRPLGRDGQVVTRQFVVEGGAPIAPGAKPDPVPNAPAPRPPVSTSPAPPVASASPVPAPAAPPIPTPAAATTTPANAGPAQSAASSATPPSPPVAAAPVAAPPVANQLAGNSSPAPAPGPAASQANAPAAAAASGSVPGGAQANLVVAAARRWLDAYHRQDRAAMAALSADNLLLADERRNEERFAPTMTEVTRTLDRVSVQIAADTAVLTAVMVESSASAPSHVSPISQVWILGGGQWRVRQARFVSEARLNQAFVK